VLDRYKIDYNMEQKQYQWIGVLHLLTKVLGKSALPFLLLTGVLLFASPEDALADTGVLYYQDIGSTTYEANASTARFHRVGFITVDSPTSLVDSVAGFQVYNDSCGPMESGGTGNSITIASTTAQYPAGFSGDSIGIYYNPDSVAIGSSLFIEAPYHTNGAATGDVLYPGTVYGMYMESNCGSGQEVHLLGDIGVDSNFYFFGYINDVGPYEEFQTFVETTRIIDVDPTDGETTATSTSFLLASNIFINENDYNEDMFLRFRFIRQDNLQVAVANTEVLYTIIDVPIENDSYSYLSATSSVLEAGEYLYTVEIRNPSILNQILGWWNLSNLYDPGLIAQSKTSFIVVQRTILDQYIFDMASTTTALLGNPGIFEDIGDNCNPISGFDALACITALFIPNNTQIETAMNTAKSYVLTKAPVGYATRVVEIMTGGATSTLPTISYTFGTGTALEGEEMHFDFNDTLASANTILTDTLVSNQAEPMNVWEVFMQVWNIIVYGGLLLLIVSEVIGLNQHKTRKI